MAVGTAARDVAGIQQTAPPQQWQKHRIPVLDGGVKLDAAGTDLPDNASPAIQNLTLVNNRLVVDSGYIPLGTWLGQGVIGTVQTFYQYFSPDGTSVQILVTTGTVYQLNTSFQQWQLLGDGDWAGLTNSGEVVTGGTTITLSEVAVKATGSVVFTGQPINGDTLVLGGTSIEFVTSGASGNEVDIGGSVTTTLSNLLTFLDASVDVNLVKFTYLTSGQTLELKAATAGTAGNNLTVVCNASEFTFASPTPTLFGGNALANGQFLGLPLDDGEQLVVEITNIGGDVVTFTPAVPSPRNVPNTSAVQVAYPLTGNIQLAVLGITWAPNQYVIFTNQVNDVFYYNENSGYVYDLVVRSDLPPATTCTGMLMFHESLYLINTIENGTALPQRVRASDLANPFSFLPAVEGGPQTSIAAIYDLLDTEDFILYASIIGPYMILYRETTIMRGTYFGLLNEIIYWEYTIYGDGLMSPAAVAEIGSNQEFIGNGDVYDYDSSYQLTGTGDNIYQGLLSAVGILNPNYRSQTFLQYNQDYDEVWVVFVGGNTATLPNMMYRHNLEKNSWYSRTFFNQMVSAAPYLPLETTTWATAVGTWEEQTATWNSRIFQANVANLVLCAGDVNQVFVYDYFASQDDGNVIDWSLQTKDIGEGDQMNRWDSVRVLGVGSDVLVEFSVDEGNTWTSIGSMTFGSTPTVQILTMQAVSPYIRFQLSGNDPTFEFRWLEVWYQMESEY